jgi:hypothetical protein
MMGALAISLAGSFRAMKAAEAARNRWWAEGRGIHAAGGESDVCDDAASAQDDRARSIRDDLKAAILSEIPGWTEAMVRDVFA